MADEQQTIEGSMLKWQEMQRKKKAAEMPGEAPTLTDRVATSTSTTKAPSLNYEKVPTIEPMDPYVAPDTSSLRTEYAADKAEKRKDYEDQRNTNAWSELAQKIGNGLARYGAAQEGAKKGISIGKIDTGTDVDYSDRTKLAYKDYVDELADLQTLRKDQEKELLTSSASEYASRLEELKRRATEAQKILDRNLDRDKIAQRDRESADTLSLRTNAAEQDQAARSDIEREKLAEKRRAAVVNNLQAQAREIQDLAQGYKNKAIGKEAVAAQLGVPKDKGYLWDSFDDSKIQEAIGLRQAEISKQIEQANSGVIPQAQAEFVRVRDPKDGSIKTIPRTSLAAALKDGAVEVK